MYETPVVFYRADPDVSAGPWAPSGEFLDAARVKRAAAITEQQPGHRATKRGVSGHPCNEMESTFTSLEGAGCPDRGGVPSRTP